MLRGGCPAEVLSPASSASLWFCASTRPEPGQQCQALVLCQYKTCPFCIKVRHEISRLSLKINRIDAQHEGADRQELLKRGGHAKAPCLKITDAAGKTQRLYDSEKIVAYLLQNCDSSFTPTATNLQKPTTHGATPQIFR